MSILNLRIIIITIIIFIIIIIIYSLKNCPFLLSNSGLRVYFIFFQYPPPLFLLQKKTLLHLMEAIPLCVYIYI